jgi:hypothetical protein
MEIKVEVFMEIKVEVFIVGPPPQKSIISSISELSSMFVRSAMKQSKKPTAISSVRDASPVSS